MSESLLALPSEKRDRIINSALSEFATKGFALASTNVIVKQAGISKGALYYYVASKQELFTFLYTYSTDLIREHIISELAIASTDVFERWVQIAAAKLALLANYPLVFDFCVRALSEEDEDIQAFIANSQNQAIAEFSVKLYQDLDYSCFKVDADIEQAQQMMWWVLEGYGKSKQASVSSQQLADPAYRQTLIDEMNGYLAILKQTFYKEEYQ